MDSEANNLKEKYQKDLRARYEASLPTHPKMSILKLRIKKPTLKQLLGQNPIQDEEFGDLDKYFRLSRSK